MNTNRTIIAPATVPGRGGVSIIRMSGELSKSIAEGMCGELAEAWRFKRCSIKSRGGFRIDDGNDSFVQMGDVLHTPNLQLEDPNISVIFDVDVEQGLKSRKQVFDMVCNDRIICSGGHMLEPKFGYLDKFGSGYKLSLIHI